MSENDPERHGLGDQLAEAYNRMLERVRKGVDEVRGEVEEDALPALERALARAKETATELGELSREEADRIGDYLKRDLQDAAEFVSQSGQELRDWLNFDLKLVKRGLADLFAQVVDRTRIDLAELQRRAETMGEWRTGEVTALGTLECKGCGEQIHFTEPGRIPPCPKCHGTHFRRVSTHPDEE